MQSSVCHSHFVAFAHIWHCARCMVPHVCACETHFCFWSSQWHVWGDDAGCQHSHTWGAQTHTCICRCMWSYESRLLNDGLFWVGSGVGGLWVQRGRSGKERPRCRGEDKLDVQKQTVFVPEAQWLSACGTGGGGGELCVCVSVCLNEVSSSALFSQLCDNRWNELVWNIELNSMNRVICFTNTHACLSARCVVRI